MSADDKTESEEAPVIEPDATEEDGAETENETLADAEDSPATGEELNSAESPDPGYSLKRVLEAILFASQKPVSSKELLAVLKGAASANKENPTSPALAFAKVKVPQIQAAIEELENECAQSQSTHEVRETAAGWQLVTKPEFSPWLRQLYPENRPARLSAPALETLAIIAYRQPITRADIEAVRGVAVDGVMQTLLDRSLVKIAGRADIPGRPLLYETSQFFMEHFGLKDLEDLPNASELRTISLPTAEVPEEASPEESPAEGDQADAEKASQDVPEPSDEPGGETDSEEETESVGPENEAVANGEKV